MASAAERPEVINGNRLLDGLPPADLERLRPHLTLVRTEARDPLWEPHRPIQIVYFPVNSVISIIAVDEAGGQIEVGTIGREGLAGLPLFLGARNSPGRAFTQVSGDNYRLSAEAFLRFKDTMPSLRERLQLYTQGFLTQVSQSVACNQLHPADQRLARWLLSCADRVGEDSFPMTQDFMGQMLGVRRATVSEAARALQKRKLLRYSRGVIEILDRPALIAAACSCYRIVRDEYEKLLGTPVG